MTGAARAAPALSVIVIGYANEETIVRAVESVVNQSADKSVELIVVTSGGDRSADRVRRRFEHLVVIDRPERLLPGAARNVGVAAARGEVIAFLAADCVAEPGWVAARLARHRERRRVVASAMTNGGPRTPAGWAAHYLTFSGRLPGRTAGPVVPPDPAAHGLSFPRDELTAIDGFSEAARVGEDTDAAHRVHARGTEIFFDPAVRTAHFGPAGTLSMLADQFRRGARHSRAVGPRWPDARLPTLLWRSLLAGQRLLRQIWHQAWHGAADGRPRLVVLAPWLVGGVAAYLCGRVREERSLRAPAGPPSRVRRVWLAAAIGVLGAVGVFVILVTSRRGIGISPDSVVYIGAGRAFAAGRGVVVPNTTTPLTLFPPLYPVVLGAAGAVGIDAAVAARGLSAACFGAAIAATGALVLRATRCAWAALLASVLTLTAAAQLETYAWAWSEPLYIALVLGFLLALAAYLDRGGPGWLATAAVLAAGAALTRYAGIAVLATGGVAILLLRCASARERLRHAAAFLLASGAPLALWLLRNIHLTGTATPRAIGVDPPGLDVVGRFAGAMAVWFVPVSVPASIRIAFLVIALAIAGAAIVRLDTAAGGTGRGLDGRRQLVALLGLFTAMCLLVVLGSLGLLDRRIAGEPERMLAPLWGPILTILVAGVHRLTTTSGAPDAGRVRRALAAGAAAALTLVVVLSLSRASAWIAVYRHEGHGFAARRWTESTLIAAVRSEPSSRTVFSNVRSAVSWLAGRAAEPIPSRVDQRTGRSNREHDVALGALGEQLVREDGRIAYFDVRTDIGLSAEELASRLHLVVIKQAPDGWYLGPSAPQGR